MTALQRSRWITVRQLAERLNIPRRSAYNLVNEGHFVALRHGRTLRIEEGSVEAYLKRQINLFYLENGFSCQKRQKRQADLQDPREAEYDKSK